MPAVSDKDRPEAAGEKASESYHKENEVLVEWMNRLAEDLSEKQKKHLVDIFVACSRYEAAFWDMAWEMRR